MLTFPTHLFNPARIVMRPTGSTITGGESLAGEVDTIRTDGGGYWLVEMLGIELLSPDLIRAWRAWEDELESGITQVLVPVADIRQAPRPVVGGVPVAPGPLLATSTDPYFPETLGYVTPYITAKVVDDADLRATTLVILIETGSPIKGGEVFAIDHATKGRRCYRIRRVLERDGLEATVLIRTPLREAVDADTSIDFDWPSLVCTAVPENSDAVSPEIDYGNRATVGILFREAFGA